MSQILTKIQQLYAEQHALWRKPATAMTRQDYARQQGINAEIASLWQDRRRELANSPDTAGLPLASHDPQTYQHVRAIYAQESTRRMRRLLARELGTDEQTIMHIAHGGSDV